MVFYAALTYGLEAVGVQLANMHICIAPSSQQSRKNSVHAGYELLRCHVDIAQGVAADFQVSQNTITMSAQFTLLA